MSCIYYFSFLIKFYENILNKLLLPPVVITGLTVAAPKSPNGN